MKNILIRYTQFGWEIGRSIRFNCRESKYDEMIDNVEYILRSDSKSRPSYPFPLYSPSSTLSFFSWMSRLAIRLIVS